MSNNRTRKASALKSNGIQKNPNGTLKAELVDGVVLILDHTTLRTYRRSKADHYPKLVQETQFPTRTRAERKFKAAARITNISRHVRKDGKK